MDATILGAIITAIGTIVAAIIMSSWGAPVGLTILVVSIAAGVILAAVKVVAPVRKSPLAAFAGKWAGKAYQQTGAAKEATITCTLRAYKDHLEGQGMLEATITRGESKGETYQTRIIITATSPFNRHLTAQYHCSPPGREQDEVRQFGTLLLELGPDSRTLKGSFEGYGPYTISEKVRGTIVLKKL